MIIIGILALCVGRLLLESPQPANQKKHLKRTPRLLRLTRKRHPLNRVSRSAKKGKSKQAQLGSNGGFNGTGTRRFKKPKKW